MFRKLRRQLTLVNMGIMALLFLILTAGSYLFAQDRLTTGAAFLLKRVATDLISGKLDDLPPRPNRGEGMSPEPAPGPRPGPAPILGPGFGPGPSVFFVRVNAQGEIMANSSNLSLSAEDLVLLLAEARSLKSEQGTLTLAQVDYNYLKTNIPGQTDYYFLFQDFSREKNALRIVITALILIGLVCIFLSFFGSRYLANKAMIPIQQAWQQQRDFLADASHELRTPLAVIQTNLEVVRSAPDDAVKEQEHWLENIQTEVSCMTKLVDSLLFLARADSHQQILNKSNFDLGKAVCLAGAPFIPAAERKEIKLGIHTETITYFGDEGKLCQVVAILTDNAIRNTPAGGMITISLKHTIDSIVLIVRDTGEGIAAEHLPKIFHRFYQANPARTNGGSGLGLSIAKLIVESHNGTIKVISSPGAGATFTVTLPLS
ncbi:sensor histidine kinase [Sporomusa termitida]|uniref:histidine kinase n=1 Tax=Sporomusa termitida TaxID=2377 RepID=A0A517DRK7_9FIRM|nr:ATP-binding protein [Sporomusa termitida]QDR79992.1 Adaptive-response sensory-kinase SasA [Sporomusa termitida]